MREIKFRAWDKRERKMHENVGVIPRGGVVEYENIEDNHRMEDCELMQYTGLKDKDGKDIFEGDILMYPDTEGEHVDVGIGMVKVAETQLNSFWPVEYRDGEFGLNVKGGELCYGTSEKQPTWISLRALFEDYISPEECEVIGNVYEHSHLLNQGSHDKI